jgi:hypothetical protein
MLALRVLGLLALAAMFAGALMYVFTGDRKYLRFTLRLLKYAVILALAVFGLLILERLVVIV